MDPLAPPLVAAVTAEAASAPLAAAKPPTPAPLRPGVPPGARSGASLPGEVAQNVVSVAPPGVSTRGVLKRAAQPESDEDDEKSLNLTGKKKRKKGHKTRRGHVI